MNAGVARFRTVREGPPRLKAALGEGRDEMRAGARGTWEPSVRATSRPLSEKREWNRGTAASHAIGHGGFCFYQKRVG